MEIGTFVFMCVGKQQEMRIKATCISPLRLGVDHLRELAGKTLCNTAVATNMINF